MLETTQAKLLWLLSRVAFSLELIATRGLVNFKDCPRCGCTIAREGLPRCPACDYEFPRCARCNDSPKEGGDNADS